MAETKDKAEETVEEKVSKTKAPEYNPVEGQTSNSVPGGRYIVNGEMVDANGKPLGKKKED